MKGPILTFTNSAVTAWKGLPNWCVWNNICFFTKIKDSGFGFSQAPVFKFQPSFFLGSNWSHIKFIHLVLGPHKKQVLWRVESVLLVGYRMLYTTWNYKKFWEWVWLRLFMHHTKKPYQNSTAMLQRLLLATAQFSIQSNVRYIYLHLPWKIDHVGKYTMHTWIRHGFGKNDVPPFGPWLPFFVESIPLLTCSPRDGS